jgi:hypothetical protein
MTGFITVASISLISFVNIIFASTMNQHQNIGGPKISKDHILKTGVFKTGDHLSATFDL